jgi:hypothetical protein
VRAAAGAVLPAAAKITVVVPCGMAAAVVPVMTVWVAMESLLLFIRTCRKRDNGKQNSETKKQGLGFSPCSVLYVKTR